MQDVKTQYFIAKCRKSLLRLQKYQLINNKKLNIYTYVSILYISNVKVPVDKWTKDIDNTSELLEFGTNEAVAEFIGDGDGA